MTDEEFNNYLDEAIEELEIKQNHLILEYGLGSHERFVVDYEDDSLLFFEKEKPVVEAKILPVASYIKEKQHLKWFWSNKNFPEEVNIKGEPIKILHEITGHELFIDDFVNEVDEDMAYEIAALACKALNAKGIYIIPHTNLASYVLIKEIKHYG